MRFKGHCASSFDGYRGQRAPGEEDVRDLSALQRSKADARTKRRGLLLILAGICYGLVGLRGVQLLVEVAVYNLAPTRGHDSVRTNIALDLLGAASVLLGIVCIFVGLRMLRTGGRQKDGG
ncbi:MAG: hypothetical protein DYH07_12430 [Armatimonadetes bacterium ATM1]|nr:hypothetical protein [Armatimonadota bacterium]MCE7900881.1 hypothetical protein [Armatimonadetes bacterium ATM1]RIJ94454.1 MAG: hypothetical protein DCC45_12410 [Armatimonadota bacterium]